ncbi:hypothetical protein EUTSA_v10026748mg, partial [Eutrema salsugineum]
MSPPELQRARESNPILELKILSASEVSHINATDKMDVYAVVSISGDNNQKKQAAKTPIDFYGGSNPTWNHTVKFSVNQEAARMTLKVKLFSYWLEGENDLYLGEVNVSVQELLASNPFPPLTNGNEGKLKLVTYPVKITERTKGTLSLSYQFKPAAPVHDMSPSAPDYSLSFGQPVYPNPDPASFGQPVMYSPQFQTKLTLELVIKSAKDIKGVSIRNEMNVYASVMIREGKTTIKDTANTPIVYCAYRNPRWDHEVEFSLEKKLVREGRLTLVVKIIGVRPLLGDKNVGEVVVSIQELFELNPPFPPLTNGNDDLGVSSITRDVTGPHGAKGTLTFTYRFFVEEAPQPFIMYPVHGTSGYAIVHPGANAGPSNGQLPLYMPQQYH